MILAGRGLATAQQGISELERNALRRRGQLEAAELRKSRAAELGVPPSRLFEALLEKYWDSVSLPDYYVGLRKGGCACPLRCDAEVAHYPTRGTARKPGAE